MLSVDVHVVLELCAVGLHIGGATIAGTEVELDVEAAHTDGAMALGAEVKFVLDFGPGFLEGIGLFGMPLRAIHLFTGFGGAAPEAAEEANANIHDIGGGANGGANGARVHRPLAFLANEAESKVTLRLIAHV